MHSQSTHTLIILLLMYIKIEKRLTLKIIAYIMLSEIRNIYIAKHIVTREDRLARYKEGDPNKFVDGASEFQYQTIVGLADSNVNSAL